MPNPIVTAVAVVRRRPMLAVAGAGVAGVALIAGMRRPPADAEQQVQGAATAAPSYGMPSIGSAGGSFPLPQALGPGDLATADLANAIREGNAAQLNAIATLQNALAPNPDKLSAAIRGSIQPLVDSVKTISAKIPAPSSGPAKPPATPTKSEPTKPPAPPKPKRLTDAQALVILRQYGHPEWLAGAHRLGYPLNSSADLIAWIRRNGGKPVSGAAPKPTASSGARSITYTVRSGDTLSRIAARYGTPGGWSRIYADNRSVIGTNPNLIRPGQRLRVLATKGI